MAQHGLIDLILTPSSDFTVSPQTVIYFNLSGGPSQFLPINNVQCSWSTIPPTEHWSTDIAELPFSMGTHDVVPNLSQNSDTTMTLSGMCSNDVTTNYAVSTDINIVVDDVTIISVDASAPDWWRNETTVTITLEPIYSSLIVTVIMGDEGRCILSEFIDVAPGCTFGPVIDNGDEVQIELGYTYPFWGEFPVVAVVETASRFTDTSRVTATVIEWVCDPPTLTLPDDVSNGTIREIPRSETSSITVEWDNNCMKTNQVCTFCKILNQYTHSRY